jgi:streptogrisin D
MTRYVARGRNLRHLLITALAVALLAALVVPPAQAASESDDLTSAAVAAMVDDLDISAAEAADRLAQQPAQAALAAKLTRQLGDSAAGAWIDEASGELHVNVLDASAAQQVRDAGAIAVRVDRSLDRLEQAKAELEGADAPAGVTWAVDVPNNSLVLGIPAGTRDARTRQFIAAARELDVPVRIEKIAGDAATQAFYGGEAILGSSGGRCSAGFITAAPSGNQYVVTAGHCTNSSSTWRGDGQTIGNTAASSFPGNDYGAIRINNPSALQPVGGVVNGGGFTDITGSSQVPVGATVCKSGSTTGTTCGRVLRYNVTVRYAQGSVGQMIETNACTQPGDSGGALFAGSQAQGVVSGGSIAGCSASGFRSYFQPVNEILNNYGLTLR